MLFLLASNCIEGMMAWMGTVLGNAILMTINPAGSAEKCGHQLEKQCKPLSWQTRVPRMSRICRSWMSLLYPWAWRQQAK